MLAYRIMGLAARLLIALGVACFLLGAYLLWNSLSVGGDSLEATGEVVSYRETRDGDATLYRPRVRFETAAGDIVTFHGQLATPACREHHGSAATRNRGAIDCAAQSARECKD